MSQLYISVNIYYFLHIEEGLELVNLVIFIRLYNDNDIKLRPINIGDRRYKKFKMYKCRDARFYQFPAPDLPLSKLLS